MNVFSGHRIDPLHIKEDDIYLEDIAHALSLICRGNGHIKYFYSVAQHSLNCAKEAQSRGYNKHIVLSCLFHDASEAYMSDLITPIKKTDERISDNRRPASRNNISSFSYSIKEWRKKYLERDGSLTTWSWIKRDDAFRRE